MNLPFFAVEAYVPGGGGPESGRKNAKKAFRPVPVQKFTFPVTIRKILLSVKFLSAILGPKMAAPILWAPGKNASVLQEKPCP